MSVATILTNINAHFDANFTDTNKAFQNAPFDVAAQSEFVRLNVKFGSANQITMGGGANTYRQTGFIVCQILTEVDTGSLRGLQLADTISALYRSKIISGIQFSTPETVDFGNTEDGFYMVSVIIDFYQDSFIDT